MGGDESRPPFPFLVPYPRTAPNPAFALKLYLALCGVAQIGFRVASYLAVGAFLLSVAWWYRADVPASDQAA